MPPTPRASKHLITAVFLPLLDYGGLAFHGCAQHVVDGVGGCLSAPPGSAQAMKTRGTSGRCRSLTVTGLYIHVA